MLTERIAQLVLEGVPLRSMLVVTFTNAAAAEMRKRVQSRLVELGGDGNLPEAARMNAQAGEQSLDSACISTLHAFCGQVLRRHFHAVGLDPAFRTADDFEAGTLRHKAVEQVLDAAYEQGGEDFAALRDGFGGRRGNALSALILRVYDFAMSQVDPWGWLDSSLARYSLDGEALAGSPAAQAVRNRWADLCSEAAGRLRDARALVPDHPDYLKLSALLDGEAMRLRGLSRALSGNACGALNDLADFSFDRMTLPRAKEGRPPIDGEEVKALRDGAKALLKKERRQAAARLCDGNVQAGLLAVARPQAARLCALVREFAQEYAALKREKNVIDFSDMEHGALAALSQEDIAAEYRERFQYLFVDEYQDSSRIQEALLSLFAKGNLFCVGDVKQSIYRFRAAEPALFLERFHAAEEGRGVLIPLNRNYRSAPNVLRCVNDLFSFVMREGLVYDSSQALRPGRPEAEEIVPVRVEILSGQGAEDAEESLSDAEWEARAAARMIRERMDKPLVAAGGPRMPRYSDFALLLRSPGASAETFCRVFAQEGIPAYAELTGGYFDAVEVQVFLCLLRLVDNSRNDIALLAVLRAGIGDFSDRDISTLRAARPQGSIGAALRFAASEEAHLLPPALRSKAAAFLSFLEEAKGEAALSPLSRFLEWLLARTGYGQSVLALPGGNQRAANLAVLLERARAYEENSARGLSGFLNFLEDVRAIGKDMGEGRLTGEGNCVRVMSIHRSKGLEFPIVLLCGLGRNFNRQDERASVVLHSAQGLCLRTYNPARRAVQDNLLRAAAAQAVSQESEQEELRILYVAMTRAREELYLLGTVNHPGKRAAAWDGNARPVCMLDWVMSCLLRYEEADGFCRDIGYYRRGPFAEHTGLWQVSLLSQAGLGAPQTETAHREEFLRWRQEALLAPCEAFAAQVAQRPLPAPLPAKVAASALGAGGEEALQLPLFLQSSGLTAADRGSANHAALEQLDLTRPLDRADIHAQLAALVEAERLPPLLAEAVDVPALARYFASPLGERMRAAQRLERELPFTMQTDAYSLLGEGEGQLVTVQGVVDACFQEGDSWVLLDYKTDRILPEGEQATAARHLPQLSLYARAVTQALGPVREAYIVLLRTGSAVRLI